VYCLRLSRTQFTPQTRQDKTVLAVWTEFATVADSIQYWRLNSFVQSRLRCERMWTSLDPVYKYDVTIGITTLWIGNWVRTRQDSVHTAFRDWTKLFRNFQSPTVLTCHQFSSHREHRQDKTVLSCRCRRCELAAITTERTVETLNWNYTCTCTSVILVKQVTVTVSVSPPRRLCFITAFVCLFFCLLKLLWAADNRVEQKTIVYSVTNRRSEEDWRQDKL